jgi:hypothetical protein
MMGRRVPRAARLSGLVVVLPVLLFGAGCATAGAAFRAGPAGIPAERSIRTNLATGRAASAWAAMSDKKIAPRDALLRHMYRGVIAMHSGDHEAGTRSLDRAWTVAEDRYTKSVSRGALSMMTAEATLPYGPAPITAAGSNGSVTRQPRALNAAPASSAPLRSSARM